MSGGKSYGSPRGSPLPAKFDKKATNRLPVAKGITTRRGLILRCLWIFGSSSQLGRAPVTPEFFIELSFGKTFVPNLCLSPLYHPDLSWQVATGVTKEVIDYIDVISLLA